MIFLSMDSEVGTSEIPTQSNILNTVKNKTNIMDCNEDEDT